MIGHLTSNGRPDWHKFAFAVIAAAVAVVFLQTLKFAFVPYDDPAFILGNEYVSRGVSLQGIKWAFSYIDAGLQTSHQGVANLWHPLTWLSHMVDVQLFGLQHPGYHHLTSVVLHLLASWLVYLLANELSSSRIASLFAALFFAIHPLHVESVAWVSARKDVLSGLFFFSSLYLILKGRKSLAYGAFLGALMAKPSTVVLPLIVIIITGWREGEETWGLRFWVSRLLQWKWWLLTAFLAGLLTVWLQGQGSHSSYMENLPLAYRLKHLAGGLLLMIWHTLYPVDLTFHYRYQDHSAWIPVVSWLLLVGVGGAVWLGRRKFPGWFLAFAWFLICSLPSSGILYVGTSYTADRYSYLGLTAFFIVAGMWLAEGKVQACVAKLKIALATVLLLFLCVLSCRQTATWKDGEALFSHGAKVQPNNPVILHNLGATYQVARRHEEAIQLFQQVLNLTPRDGRAWYNLGNSLRETGQLDEAVNAYRRASEISPGHANTWRNLGLMLSLSAYLKRDPAEAREAFHTAVQLTSRKDPVPLLMLAHMEFELGNHRAAQALVGELQTLQPQDEQVRQSMEQLQRMLGDALR